MKIKADILKKMAGGKRWRNFEKAEIRILIWIQKYRIKVWKYRNKYEKVQIKLKKYQKMKDRNINFTIRIEKYTKRWRWGKDFKEEEMTV